MEHLLLEMGIVIIAASLGGILSHFFRQPLILAYILAGVLIGPAALHIVGDVEFVKSISEIGILLLLFLVGTEISLSRLKDLGKVSLIAGIGQVVLTSVVTFGIAKLFEFSFIESIYLAVALTFSSTVIAVKLLYEKKATSSTYGQICIGILIVQDVLAILALLLLAGFQAGSFTFDIWHFGKILAAGALLALTTLFFANTLLRRLYSIIATSHELLIITGLSWCFIVAFSARTIGFSAEIGAFIAGLSLANLPYTFEINTKTKVLRDFFITLFFVGLGASMIFDNVGDLIVPAVLLSLFVLIGNPLIVLFLMGRIGYDKRTSLFTGLAVANISEFSLIVIAMGQSLGHIDEQIVSMVTIIALITMALSSYMILNNNQIYRFLHPFLHFLLPKDSTKRQFFRKEPSKDHIILLGCSTMGEQILEQVLRFKKNYLVVDYDNSVIKKLIQREVPCIYGDMNDEELLEELNLDEAEIIISTLGNPQDLHTLLGRTADVPLGKRPLIIATANSGREGLDLFRKGVDYVILKPYLGASHVHTIHKEIYELETEFGLLAPSSTLKMEETHEKLESDMDYARLLHNLNKLRLKEIMDKIKKKELSLKRDKV